MLELSKLAQMPGYQVSADEHALRTAVHRKASNSLSESIKKYLARSKGLEIEYECATSDFIDRILTTESTDIFASSPGHDEPFGAVGTVGSAGCIAFVAYNIYQLYRDFYDRDYPNFLYNVKDEDFQEIVNSVVQNGYRIWRFEKSKQNLSLPTIELDSVKKIFSANQDVQECKNLEELEKVLGKPVGIGGHMFFLDQFIATLGGGVPYFTTRIWTVQQLFDRICSGTPVPIRINNSIFCGDKNMSGGHYVIWLGIDTDNSGEAVVIDSRNSQTVVEIPVEQLLRSMIEDSENYMTCAWDVQFFEFD